MWDRLAVRMGVRRSNSCNLHPDLTSPPDCGYQGGPLEEAPACSDLFYWLRRTHWLWITFRAIYRLARGRPVAACQASWWHTQGWFPLFPVFIPVFVRFEEDGSPKSLKAFLDSTGGGLTFSFRLLKMIKQEKIWYISFLVRNTFQTKWKGSLPILGGWSRSSCFRHKLQGETFVCDIESISFLCLQYVRIINQDVFQ